MKSSTEKIGITIIMLLALLFFIWGYSTKRNSLYSLKENKEFTKAVIWDISPGVKSRLYMKYEFFIEEKRYSGEDSYESENRRFSIGDTCGVIYDKTNPNNNMVATRF